jgi:hypothetical protein
MSTLTEVQAHGFSIQNDLLLNVYKVTSEELPTIPYTSEVDLPASFNRLRSIDTSIKTSCSANTICMADCLRVYDSVTSEKKLHMTAAFYKQINPTTKRINKIVEVDLTNAVKELFGNLARENLEQLDKLVKTVPQKRSPTPEEHAAMYALRDSLQKESAAIQLNIKCNSQQSRLQCSFNKFQAFLKAYPERIIAQVEVPSDCQTVEFCGGTIATTITSAPRKFKTKSG